MNYRVLLLDHLANYKTQVLGVHANGVWRKNGRHYAHILPEELQELNILEGIRKRFWSGFNTDQFGALHTDFHHLNSSQAMCFNLFYPFIALSDSHTNLLLKILGLPESGVQAWKFEYVANAMEGTHFDLYICLTNGMELFFEIKLSESGFGSGKRNLRREAKLNSIYAPLLKGKVNPCYLDPARFFDYYQLLRNISYVVADGRGLLFLVAPRSNPITASEVYLLDDMLEPLARKSVRSIWLEDLVAAMLVGATGNTLSNHLAAFERKYLPKPVSSK